MGQIIRKVEITFLGTSGCIPTKERGLSAVHLSYLGETMLFDCGEGTQRQMRCAGLNFMALEAVYLTHLHADHFMGLGGMLQSMDFLEREKPLLVYGPEGTERLIEMITSLGSFHMDYLQVEAKEVSSGMVHRGIRYKVTCAPTEHNRASVAFCFTEDPHRKFDRQKALDLGVPAGRLFKDLSQGESVEVDGKTITAYQVLADPILGRKFVYTGDTRACDAVKELAKNADVLVHEAMFSHEDIEVIRDVAHSTTVQAANIAKNAGVKDLYLTHISQRYTDPSILEAEARQVFENSHIAEDFMKVIVPKHW